MPRWMNCLIHKWMKKGRNGERVETIDTPTNALSTFWVRLKVNGGKNEVMKERRNERTNEQTSKLASWNVLVIQCRCEGSLNKWTHLGTFRHVLNSSHVLMYSDLTARYIAYNSKYFLQHEIMFTTRDNVYNWRKCLQHEIMFTIQDNVYNTIHS